MQRRYSLIPFLISDRPQSLQTSYLRHTSFLLTFLQPPEPVTLKTQAARCLERRPWKPESFPTSLVYKSSPPKDWKTKHIPTTNWIIFQSFQVPASWPHFTFPKDVQHEIRFGTKGFKIKLTENSANGWDENTTKITKGFSALDMYILKCKEGDTVHVNMNTSNSKRQQTLRRSPRK